MIVKICGITRPEDAAAAVALGADLVGMVFAPSSPRRVSAAVARDIVLAVAGDARTVGVFAGAGSDEIQRLRREVKFDIVQLHGGEPPELCAELVRRFGGRVIQAFRGEEEAANASEYAGVFARLFDASSPGSGQAWNWDRVASAPRDRPVMLAGGLNAKNLAQAVRLANPDGVDVSTGVESSIGVKDPDEMQAFLETARGLSVVQEDE